MKTAISLPDALYEDAEVIAEAMGIPRSQLFAKALEEFILHHKKERITQKLNDVYGKLENMAFEGDTAASLEAMREMTRDDAW